MPSKFILFCEPCAFKKIVDEPQSTEEIKRPQVPGGEPKMDLETKTLKEQKKMKQPIMSKCPKCGRGVALKRLPDAYVKAYDDQEKREREEKERQKKCQQETQ